MFLYCIVIVTLYCPPKEVCLYRNLQLGSRKSVRCKEVSDKNCPPHRGFLIRILYETNPFLKKVSVLGDLREKSFKMAGFFVQPAKTGTVTWEQLLVAMFFH